MCELKSIARGALALSLMGLSCGTYAADAKAPMSDQEIVASAMTAAPAKVAQNATVVAMDAKAAMRTVRKGSNGFTCMADDPQTPGPDPMCMDRNAMEFVHAMLAGGTDASNTDPYAQKPTATNHWIKTGPHVMVVGAEPSSYDQYPKAAAPSEEAAR